MSKVERLNRVFNTLKSKGVFHTQIDASKLMGCSRQNMSSALKGDERVITEKFLRRFSDAFNVNLGWLLTGEGVMLSGEAVTEVSPTATRSVRLYSLSVVAGFDETGEQEQRAEGEMPWTIAREGDFAVHVSGDSMSPNIPDGSIVLLRPYPHMGYLDLDYGHPHVVVTDDGSALLKVIKLDRDTPGRILLLSYNTDYPPRSIPVDTVRRVFRAVAVQAPL